MLVNHRMILLYNDIPEAWLKFAETKAAEMAWSNHSRKQTVQSSNPHCLKNTNLKGIYCAPLIRRLPWPPRCSSHTRPSLLLWPLDWIERPYLPSGQYAASPLPSTVPIPGRGFLERPPMGSPTAPRGQKPHPMISQHPSSLPRRCYHLRTKERERELQNH